MVKKQLAKLDKTVSPGPAPTHAMETQPLQVQVEALEEEMVQLGPVPEEEIDVVDCFFKETVHEHTHNITVTGFIHQELEL